MLVSCKSFAMKAIVVDVCGLLYIGCWVLGVVCWLCLLNVGYWVLSVGGRGGAGAGAAAAGGGGGGAGAGAASSAGVGAGAAGGAGGAGGAAGGGGGGGVVMWCWWWCWCCWCWCWFGVGVGVGVGGEQHRFVGEYHADVPEAKNGPLMGFARSWDSLIRSLWNDTVHFSYLFWSRTIFFRELDLSFLMVMIFQPWKFRSSFQAWNVTKFEFDQHFMYFDPKRSM